MSEKGLKASLCEIEPLYGLPARHLPVVEAEEKEKDLLYFEDLDRFGNYRNGQYPEYDEWREWEDPDDFDDACYDSFSDPPNLTSSYYPFELTRREREEDVAWCEHIFGQRFSPPPWKVSLFVSTLSCLSYAEWQIRKYQTYILDWERSDPETLWAEHELTKIWDEIHADDMADETNRIGLDGDCLFYGGRARDDKKIDMHEFFPLPKR